MICKFSQVRNLTIGGLLIIPLELRNMQIMMLGKLSANDTVKFLTPFLHPKYQLQKVYFSQILQMTQKGSVFGILTMPHDNSIHSLMYHYA